MAHRRVLSSSQMCESDHQQNWNYLHIEHPFLHLAIPVAVHDGSFSHPAENVPDGMILSSPWNFAPRLNSYSSSSQNIEGQYYQIGPSDLACAHFLHPSNREAFCCIPETYAHSPCSSSNGSLGNHGVEGHYADPTVSNETGHHKRKNPEIRPVSERGSSSNGSPGSSTPWDYLAFTPGFRGNGLSIGDERSVRNVRSRASLDLEPNLDRAHFSVNPSNIPCSTSCPIDSSSSMDQGHGVLTGEWNQGSMRPSHRMSPGADASGFIYEANQFFIGSTAGNASLDLGGYHNGFMSSRSYVVPLGFHDNFPQSIRGFRSSFGQTSGSTLWASTSSSHSRYMAPSDRRLKLVAENYMFRNPRPEPFIGWRSSDRNGRLRILSGRYQSPSGEAFLHNQLSSEGPLRVDHFDSGGSGNTIDQHSEMRLDIDNMSYEELLELGERIGSVNTGLSEDLISKCLMETVGCSSDQIQKESTCVICLEAFGDKDNVGELKICCHDYHASCIKHWLSMKNSCPICKESALPDHIKGP